MDAERTPAERFVEAARAVLPPPEAALLADLHAFTSARLDAARALADDAGPWTEARLHGFLRECWDALDGFAREANALLAALLPDAGLYPPLEMTRQCTLYQVRRILSENAPDHPVARHIHDHTRDGADEPYRRLSFLYNLSLFLPVTPDGGRLPGTDELPAHVLSLLKPARIAACPVDEGVRRMRTWLSDFISTGYSLLAR